MIYNFATIIEKRKYSKIARVSNVTPAILLFEIHFYFLYIIL